ncbi:unnamed protein product [Adineta steineri]|uniref:Uncharacterized protein n=1 Tax=Adineta steineri TaxID=433720 RepID=A0A815JNJ9_9BILA|nr:unnamed protein product [Adineta steineri]CAF1249883.1 unnamed protein product [Adineta steineri]CAF1382125.1 unnamed protein product [Adineta steineri]
MEKLLVIRLLCLEHFINALSQYVIKQIDFNTIQINDYDFQGINIITLPNIPQYREDILKTKGKNVNPIDCQFTNIVYDLIDNDIVYLRNVHLSSFSTLFKQIRSKGQHDVAITKDVSIDLIYLGARLYHYDC